MQQYPVKAPARLAGLRDGLRLPTGLRLASGTLRSALVVVALLLLVIWPLVMLVAGAFRSGPDDADWTLDALGILLEPAFLSAAGNSLLLALASTLSAILLALLLAFATARLDFPLRRLVLPVMAAVFIIPPFFYATGFVLLGNAYSGWANDLLAALWPGLPRPAINLESWGGILLVMTLKKVAFSYIFLLGPVRSLSASHLEAALTCGASLAGAVFQQLQALRLTLVSLALLNFAVGLQVFNEVLVLGGTQDLRTLSVVIYRLIQDFNPPHYAQACAAAIFFLCLTFPLILLQSRLQGGGSFAVIDARNRRHTHRWALGRWQWLVTILVAGWLILSLLLPVATLLLASLQPFPGTYENLGLDSYVRVLTAERTAHAFFNTWALGALAGLAAMLLGVAIASNAAGAPRWLLQLRQLGALVPMTLPGIVSGLAVMWAYVSVPGLRQLYGTAWLMLVALIVVILPLAVQLSRAALAQVGPELREAAWTAGAPFWRTLLDVDLRLLLPSLLAGWGLCAVILSGVTEIPLLLGSPATPTVIREAWTLYSQGDIGAAAALLILLLLSGLLVAGVLLLVRQVLQCFRPRPKSSSAGSPRRSRSINHP